VGKTTGIVYFTSSSISVNTAELTSPPSCEPFYYDGVLILLNIAATFILSVILALHIGH
jgi:hypothetical protein